MRPIDADDAIHQIDMGKDGYNIAFLLQTDSYTSGAFDAIDHDISVLKTAPTLDAVPVIRCTKCKYYGPGDHAGFWRCENWGVDINRQASPPETFYCADGETKEGSK